MYPQDTMLIGPYVCTTAFQSSLVPSSIFVWNHQPNEALYATTVRTLKLFTALLFMHSYNYRCVLCCVIVSYLVICLFVCCT